MSEEDRYSEGVRGHGIVEGRYPSDALRGRNVVRRQLDVRAAHNPTTAQGWLSGVEKLRPGLWRLLPTFEPYGENWPGPVLFSVWFRLNEPCAHSQADPYPLQPGNPPDEPISWVVGYREVFVDEECDCYYTLPVGSSLTFVLLSELDEP